MGDALGNKDAVFDIMYIGDGTGIVTRSRPAGIAFHIFIIIIIIIITTTTTSTTT